MEPGAWRVDLEHRVPINQSAGTQGEVSEPIASSNEIGDVRMAKHKVVEFKHREPPEGNWTGTGEGHEQLPQLSTQPFSVETSP